MPPRRKAAKKNVRTPKSKAKPESPPPPSPDPEPETLPDIQPESPTPPSLDPEPETLPDIQPEPEPEPVSAETPVTNDAETSTAAVEPVAAVQETLAVAETRETDEKPDSATETLEAVAEVAGGETVAEEPAASETQEMATEVAPASAETEKKKTRKVTVVKKVIKKKIVKKLVPKAAALVMEDAKVVDEKTVVAENPKEEITEVALAQETTKEGDKEEEVAEVAQEIVKEEEKPDEITEVVPEIKKEEEKKVETTEMVTESVKGEESTEMVPKTAKEEEKKEEIEEVVPGSTKEEEKKGDVEMEEAGVLERKSRKKTEIFVGGLDRDAKEEDLRMVFGKAGEIVEVRMIMDTQSGKNKGYAFVRFADVSHAKKAVTDFEKVEICGKLCGASAIKGNDTLFLGNIDKKWKKEDIEKLLHGIGIEKIEAVTIMSDRKSTGSNRGFAFVEFETNKDAQNAFKKLQKKDAFGRGLNIKIAWAEPLNDPDEEEVKKVKSVYAEGIPSSWNEEKIRESFKKFGEIERIVLARNIKSAKRKDFAFVNYSTREAAILCIESFDKEELTDNGSKVNVKVSLAKPAQKGKQSKVGSKYSEKEKPKAVPRDTKASISYNAGNHPNRGVGTNANGTRSSANHELLHVLREQATWKPAQVGHAGNLFYAGGPSLHDYPHGAGGKRPFSSLGDESFYSDPRGYPRPRPDSFPGASYGSMPHGMAGSSHPYYQHQDPGYAPAGSYYGPTDPAATHQIRQGAPPYGSGSYYPGGPRHGF